MDEVKENARSTILVPFFSTDLPLIRLFQMSHTLSSLFSVDSLLLFVSAIDYLDLLTDIVFHVVPFGSLTLISPFYPHCPHPNRCLKF